MNPAEPNISAETALQTSDSALPLGGLTMTYLALPALLFAWGWLRTPYAAAVTLVAGIAIFFALRDAWRERDRTPFRRHLRLLWPALILLLAWLLLSGIGGFGLQNGDYKSSNALLRGLIESDWPLRIEFQRQTVHVVYYLAYFLPPAAVGKAFGWEAANIFILLWTLTGILLAFGWFRRLTGSPRRSLGALSLAALFCLASGLDAVGHYLDPETTFQWGAHIENWADFFQFSSQTTLLFWVPQQALAAWLMAGLTLACLDDSRLVRYLGMSVAAGVLWTPFGVVGTAPFLLAAGITLLIRKQARVLFAPLSIGLNLGAALIAVIHALYISSNRYAFPIGLLWNLAEDRKAYLRTAVEFWWLEFGLLAVCTVAIHLLLRRGMEEGKKRPALPLAWFGLLGLILSILPLFKMGFNNDLVMRASVPSLFYFWVFVGRAFTGTAPPPRRGWTLALRILLLLLLLAGSYTSLSEIIRSINNYHFGPPPLDEVRPITEATYPHIVAQRMGNEETFFFHHLGR